MMHDDVVGTEARGKRLCYALFYAFFLDGFYCSTTKPIVYFFHYVALFVRCVVTMVCIFHNGNEFEGFFNKIMKENKK